jgi:hypothetical protein
VRWLDLNRPSTLRIASVLVRPAEGSLATAERVRAKALALRGSAAKTPAVKYRDPVDSETACGKDVLVQSLEGVISAEAPDAEVTVWPLATIDGFAVDRRLPSVRLANPVVRAMLLLRERGDVSDVVETAFGFHILVLLDVLPAHVADDGEVSRVCSEE